MAGIFMVVAVVLLPNIAHAADPAVATTPTAVKPEVDQMIMKVIDGLSLIMRLLQRILWPVLLMIGSLLQNDILYGPGMETNLLNIWSTIRNMVNIIFVLILLAIALYNVMGIGENYSLKKMLPKFIIALIAVNFTYIGIKVVLDSVNVVSTAIFALPVNIQTPAEGQVGILTANQVTGFCEGLYQGKVGSPEYLTNWGNATNASAGGVAYCDDKGKINTSNPTVANFFNSFNARNAALALALAMGKINLLDKVYVSSNAGAKELLLNTGFSVVLYVVYAVAFVVLFVVLLVRIVALWLMICISPIMMLKYVLPEKMVSSLGEAGNFADKFVKNAIVPITMAAVLTIGFILLQAFEVADYSKINQAVAGGVLGVGLFTSGLTTFQQLIAAMGMTVFVWTGIFTVTKDTFAGAITGAIKSAVGGAGKALAQVPLMMPLFPTAKGTASILEAKYALEAAKNIPGNISQRTWKERFPDIARLAGYGGNKETELANAKTEADVKRILGGVHSDIEQDGNRNQIGLATWAGKKKNRAIFKSWFNRSPLANRQYGTAEQMRLAMANGKMNDKKIWDELYANNNIPKGGPPEGPAAAGAGTLKTADEQQAIKQKKDYGKRKLIKPDEAGLLENLEKADTPAKIKAARAAIEKLDKANATKGVKGLLVRMQELDQATTQLAVDVKTELNKGIDSASFDRAETTLQTYKTKLVAQLQKSGIRLADANAAAEETIAATLKDKFTGSQKTELQNIGAKKPNTTLARIVGPPPATPKAAAKPAATAAPPAAPPAAAPGPAAPAPGAQPAAPGPGMGPPPPTVPPRPR